MSSDDERDTMLLNRTMPVRAHGPAFTRLSRDPRLEGEDLRRVHTGAMGQGGQQKWRSFLMRLGVTPSDLRACIGWLLAVQPTRRRSEDIQDRETAEAFMRNDEDQWSGKGPRASCANELERLVDRGFASADTRVEDLRGTAEVAFGYWLFPSYVGQAFAEGPTLGDGQGEWEFSFHWMNYTLHDLSTTWPELLIMDLS